MTRKEKSSRPAEQDERFQRKIAEQLAGRVGTSADEIEKGVKGFIEKSSEALGGLELKPPYRRPSWYNTFFTIIQERSIGTVSIEFIRLNIVSSTSEAYKLRAGLRFLDLIDNKGHPTNKLLSLRVTGDDFKTNLKRIVHDSYADLFKSIVVERAKPESIINFMIERYGYSRRSAEEATALFVYFCLNAEIALSKELQEFQISIRTIERPAHIRKTVKREKTVEEYDESFATLKSDLFSFSVKKELSAIELAREQVNSLLDYWKKRLTQQPWDRQSSP